METKPDPLGPTDYAVLATVAASLIAGAVLAVVLLAVLG